MGSLQNLIGSGSFTRVYKGTLPDDDTMMIVLGLCLVSGLYIQIGFVPRRLCAGCSWVRLRESMFDLSNWTESL